MAAEKKNPSDLLTEVPVKTASREKAEAPISVVLRNFMVKDGKELELMTRSNPTMARAAQIGYIFAHMIKMNDSDRIGSEYVAGRIEQLERLGVGMNGLGRQDQIAALQAGGRLPDAYYDKSGTSSQFDIKE